MSRTADSGGSAGRLVSSAYTATVVPEFLKTVCAGVGVAAFHILGLSWSLSPSCPLLTLTPCRVTCKPLRLWTPAGTQSTEWVEQLSGDGQDLDFSCFDVALVHFSALSSAPPPCVSFIFRLSTSQ